MTEDFVMFVDAGQTKTSILRTLGCREHMNDPDWMLPETRKLFDKQWARQERIKQGGSNTIQYNTIQCNAMHCNAMQCNAMPCNAMQNIMQCNTMHKPLMRQHSWEAEWCMKSKWITKDLVRLESHLVINNCASTHCLYYTEEEEDVL